MAGTLRGARIQSKKMRVAPKRSYYAKKKAEGRMLSRFKNLMFRAQEKKMAVEYSSVIQVGQVSTNTSGHYVFDATPTTVQGNGYGNRAGDEILVSGVRFKIQAWGQSGFKQNAKLKFVLFGVRQSSNNTGTTTTVANAFNLGWLPNPNIVSGYATNVYDFQAQPDARYWNKNYVQLKEVVFDVPAPTYSGEVPTVDCSFGLKFKKPWKVTYDAGGSTAASATYGQLGLAILMDSGNAGGANNTAFPTQLPVWNNSTGVNLTLAEFAYFTDATN